MQCFSQCCLHIIHTSNVLNLRAHRHGPTDGVVSQLHILAHSASVQHQPAVLLPCMQAASITLCPSQGSTVSTDGPEQASCCILSIPASQEQLQNTGPRFNFARGPASQEGPPPVWHNQPLLPSLSPEAPISAFLKQYTVGTQSCILLLDVSLRWQACRWHAY